jgi:hypothetical protein
MRKWFAVLLLLSFAASAQAQQDDDASVRPADDCHTTLRTGSGVTFTKVCISSSGNITSFESPAGVEHIRIRDPLEGFRVCRFDDQNPFWDTGVDEYGGGTIGPGAIYQPNGPNTLPLRITSGGATGLRVVQEFGFRTRAYGPADLTIQMKLYNDGAAIIPSVSIQRFFDADINRDIGNDHAMWTSNSVAIADLRLSGRGLMLSAGILDKPHTTHADYYERVRGFVESGTQQECVGESFLPGAMTTSPGDLAGVVTYRLGDILPGRVKTVSFIYRRF